MVACNDSDFLAALLEAAAFTLGKEPFALGKGFAECSTRQSPLGKIFLGKESLPSAFYPGTRQNKKNCRVLGAALGKIFSAVARRPLTVILPSARPSTRQKKNYFFLKLLCRVPLPRHSTKFFFIFFK